MKNLKGQSLGHGFLILSSVQEAQRIVKECDRFRIPWMTGFDRMNIQVSNCWEDRTRGGYFREIDEEITTAMKIKKLKNKRRVTNQASIETFKNKKPSAQKQTGKVFLDLLNPLIGSSTYFDKSKPTPQVLKIYKKQSSTMSQIMAQVRAVSWSQTEQELTNLRFNFRLVYHLN